ncbi:MAG: PulJ/GspJ family protein [Minisyncoccia bacterium]
MNRTHKGFTLIEMLVSVALFAIVMLMVASAYLIVIASNRQAQAVANASDNLAFALETMTRSIRTGTGYGCGVAGQDDSPCGGSFVFTDANGCAVNYFVSGSVIYESGNGVSPCPPSNEPLTGAAVTVSSLKFYLQGSPNTSASDYLQPHVTISVKGSVASGPNTTVPFDIETGATMRGTDL